MEQRVEVTEAQRDGSWIQGTSESTPRLLSASEQLYTRSCARCSGLLVNEWYCDLENTGRDGAKVPRCVQCGHRADPVIPQNQIWPPVERQRGQLAQHKHFARTVRLGEVA